MDGGRMDSANYNQNRSVGSIFLSLVLHGSLATALLISPDLTQLNPQGSRGTQIEVSTDNSSLPPANQPPAPSVKENQIKENQVPVAQPAQAVKPPEEVAPEPAVVKPTAKPHLKITKSAVRAIKKSVAPVEISKDKIKPDVTQNEVAKNETENSNQEKESDKQDSVAQPLASEDVRQATTASMQQPKNSEPNTYNSTEPQRESQMIAREQKSVASDNTSGGTGGGEGGAATGGETRSYLDLQQQPGNVPPQYPSQSRRADEQGKVQLLYYVTRAGDVTNIRVVQSSGFASLDREALRAISLFRFVPGQEGWTEHMVMFSLRGGGEASGNGLRTSQLSQ